MQVLANQNYQSQAKWCYLPENWSGEAPKPQSQTWVQLLAQEPVSPFAAEEALLLCEEENEQWVVWIPSYGETRLDISQFCITP
ncbi:MAG: hypothetical protein VKJ02_01305 [Snowella sp.]|nr:hypothetical protein [Snowella sp.]